MKSNPPIDALGREIKVGDTVVYSVKTRDGGLQKGEVLELIPYLKEHSYPNPEYGNTPADSRFIRVAEQHFKVKIKTPTTRWEWDNIAQKGEHVEYEITKTLDTPSRFAVVK